MAKKTPSEFVTKEDAAEILGVSPRTIDRLVDSKELTVYRSRIGVGRGGRRIYFKREEVEKLRDEPPTAEK